MDNDIKTNVKSSDTWGRALYMLLYVIFYSVAEIVLTAVVVFQLLLVLFTGQKNERLLKLGQSISTYVYQILHFLSFNSDYKPYPFGAWPQGEPKVRQSKNTDTKDLEEKSSDE